MPSDLLEVVAAYSPVAATTLTQPVRLGETLTDAFGLLIEEYTTNLVTNGSLELGSTTYWSGINGTAALDTSMTVFGHGSIKWTTTVAGSSGPYTTQAGQRIPVTPGVTYTSSIWVYTNAVGRSIKVGVDWYNQSGRASFSASAPIPLVPGEWQRVSVTGVCPADSTGVFCATPTFYINNAQVGDVYWYDGGQFEAKPYPTTYAYGGMGSGYAYDAAGNGITNPSFETDLSGWSTADPAFGALVRTSAQHQDGSYSAAFVGGARTTVNTVAQNSYALSAYVKAAAAAATGVYVGSTAFPTPTVENGPGRRYAIAKNGPGLLVEDAGTNLLLNPSFETGVANTSQTATGNTYSADATFAFIGSQSCKVSCDGSVAAQGIQLFSDAQPVGTYTGAAWVFAPAGTLLFIEIRSNNTDGTITNSITNFTATGVWQRVTSAALSVTKTARQLALMVRTQTASPVTFWVDAAQVEQKAYVTTFAEGSLGTGYSYDTPTHTIPNPSFEGGFQANGVPNSWSIGASATAASATGLIGSYSVQFSATTSGNLSSDRLTSGAISPALATNTTYTVSYYAKRVSGTGELAIAIDVAGYPIDQTNFGTATNPTAAARFAATFTTSGTTPANVINFVPTVAGDVWQIDGVQIEQRSYATPFGATATQGTTSSSRAGNPVNWAVSGISSATAATIFAVAKMGKPSSVAEYGGIIELATFNGSRLAIYKGSAANTLSFLVGTGGSNAVSPSVSWNVGDVLAVALAANGHYAYSINGGTAVTGINANAVAVSGFNTVYAGANFLNGILGDVTLENVIVFNDNQNDAALVNLVNGTTLPSTAAGQSDCVFSALVNNPDPTGSPWRGTSSGGFQRYSQVRSTVKGETTTDIVVLAYPGTAAAVGNAAWLDAVQWEHRDHVTPYGAAGTAGSTSTRSEGKAQFNLPSSISNAPWTAMAFVRPQQSSSTFTAKHVWLSTVAGLWVGANAGTGIGSDIGASALPITWNAGDLLWVAMSHDGSGNMTAWAANVTQGTGPASTTGTTPFTTSLGGVLVGGYTSSGYGGDAIVGPVTVLDRALANAADAFRYAQGLGAVPDPTEDRAVVAQVGYGGAAYAEKIWTASPTATAVPASPGFLQVTGSYVGDVSTTDSSGNALASNQLRFTVPGSAVPVDTGQLVQVVDSTGRYGTGDQWTVTSISDLTPGEVDLILTHI